MTKCFLHPWPVVSAAFRCSWQSLVTEEQFTNKSLACKCSILAVFIPYQLLVLFTAKVISWNCSGKVPNGCDSTCGSMHFLWVQMCLGCMVFAGKLAPPRRLCEKDWKGVIEEVDTGRWLYPSSDWTCLFAPIQAEVRHRRVAPTGQAFDLRLSDGFYWCRIVCADLQVWAFASVWTLFLCL